MLLALVFFVLVTTGGWAILGIVGEERGLPGLGLAPVVGLAALAIAAAWAPPGGGSATFP